MPSKGWTKAGSQKVSDSREILDLLRMVPYEVFVRMVAKSGMPYLESRSLCKKFKELSG